ncbi:MAG: Ig-like domain-containing protein [bacterium]|nr:Ig-like domain-containing protein [bacterium]
MSNIFKSRVKKTILANLLILLLIGCAGTAGKPEFKFKIVEFFPPSGFQISTTQFSISVAFSKIIDEQTINDENIKIFKDGSEIRKLITIPDNQKIKITPQIISRGTYKVFISKNVKSLSGEFLPEDFSWEFYVVGEGEFIIPITPPQLPPLVRNIYPPHLGLVGADTIVYAAFTKRITNISTLNFFIQDINGRIIDSSLTYIEDGDIAILRPRALLQPGETYIVTLRSVIRAFDGESLGRDVVWLFRTFGVGEDRTPPSVIFIDPPNGATGVPRNAKITILFSENIDTASLNLTNVQILEEGTNIISYNYEYNQSIFALIITPSLLQEGKRYTVKIRGISDRNGNTMASEFISTFTVGAGDGGGVTPQPPPPSGPGFPPQILRILIDDEPVNLPDIPQGVSTIPTIKILFSDRINSATVNPSTLFISDGINIISSAISFSTTLTSVAITPNVNLITKKTYWLFITNGIKDQDGENLANPITFPFKTLGITISAPSPEQYLKGIINIDVDFSAKLNRLELWIDSTRRQTALPPINSPFTFTEDTRLQPDGTKIIKAIAYLRSPPTTISYSIKVTFDNTPPSVAIQSPPEGSVISGISNIIVLANDLGKTKKVEFFVDGILNTTATSPTTTPNIYIFSLNTTALSNGNHTISFRAEDEAGNISDIVSRNVVVDNSPPTGSFISPTFGSIVGGFVNVEANVSDNIGIKKVEFYVNGVKICDTISLVCEKTSTPWKITWNSTSIPYFASASLTGVVEDLGGLKTVFSSTITVDNVSPAVSISTPFAGMYLRATTNIQVTFSDLSPVTYVAILVNDVIKFSASNPSSPYTAMWNTTSETDGSKTIKAVVYDKAGNQGISQISVVVDNTPPSGSIVSPTSGTYTNALTLNITASASDAILLDRVDFYINGNFVGFDSSPPTYTISHNISAFLETTHNITAVIYDFAGNYFVTPTPTTFIVDKTSPVIIFIDPTTNSVVDGTKLVKTTASDSGIVTIISIQAGAINLGSCNINLISGNCNKNWPTSGDVNDVVVTAKAYDKAGNEGITQIVVMVDNLFPSVSITSPPAGSYLNCPTNTVLGGTTSDINTITAVVIKLIDLSTNTVSASFNFTYPGNPTVNQFATLLAPQCGADGNKRVDFTAYDKGGKSATASRVFFVDNTPPQLTVIYPPNSECVGGVTSVRVQICDNAFVQNLSVTVGTTLISSSNISSSISCLSPQTNIINWNSTAFSNGANNVVITLKDAAGNTQVQNVPIVIDNSPPTVSIVTPLNNSTVNAPASVLATLGDSICSPPLYNFKKVEYQIAVSGTASFSSSTQNCSTTQRIPCTDTSVGAGTSNFSWAATEYCGFYNVRARGFDYVGNVSETTITLKIQPPGCPIEEGWSPQGVIGSIRTTPIIKDVNGDGKKEIIFGTETGRVYGISESTTLQNSTFSSAIRSIILEVLVAGLPKAIVSMLDPVRRIRALNLNAPFLSDFTSTITQTGIYSSASTIFSDGNTAAFLVGDLAGGVSIYEVNSSGFTYKDCIPTGTPLACGLNSPAISDINGDTQPDITTTSLPVDTDCNGSYDTVVVTASDGYITGISLATKAKIWTVYTGSAVLSSAVLADFGNDCNFEFLVGTGGGALYCIPESGSGNCPGWTSQFYSAGGAIYSLAVTDIDSCLSIGDAFEDIVFGAGVNLTILSRTGVLKTQRNLMSLVVSTPAIADINGDGCGEIFVATQNGNIHGFYLKNVGGALYPEYLTGFPKSTGSTISVGSSPVICNIDTDSRLELIIGNDGSTLRIYDLGAAGSVKWIPGATFCHLSAHGCQRRWRSDVECGY